jgi:peptide/nickel transport system permease protein
MGRLGLIVLTAVAVLGGLWAPHDPMTTRLDQISQAPSGTFWLGTDTLGRDVLSRTLHGGRATLTYGLSAASIGVVLGGLLGCIRAFGGRVCGLVEGVFVGLSAMPPWLLALSVVAGFGASPWAVVVGVGLTQIAPYGRIVAWSMEQARTKPYYLAAIAVGAPPRYLALRVVLPNVLPILAGSACVTWASAVLFASGLTFLGLGGALGVPEWGAMLAEGRGALRYAPWIALPAGMLLVGWTMCLNATGRWFSAL